MQLPPLDLTSPDTSQSDSLRDVPETAWLVIVTIVVTLASFVVLNMIHEDHAYRGDRAATPEFAACLSDQMDEFIRTGVPTDGDACKPVMPWYAAHPVWYALGIGATVLVVGRAYLFMRRVEMTHRLPTP